MCSSDLGALPQYEEVPWHGKIFGTCGFSSLSFRVSNLHLAYFYGRPFKLLIEWRRWPMTRAGP